MTKPPTQREVIRIHHEDSGYTLHIVRKHDHDNVSSVRIDIDHGGGIMAGITLTDEEARQVTDALANDLARYWPECQADVQDSCEGDIMEYDGYWFCWKHHELFNTDGIHVKGLPWIVKRDWGGGTRRNG